MYTDFLQTISNNENIFLLDPGISANSVIPQSIGTINYPFTSTALISQASNVETVYYDPLSIFDKHQFSIPILDSQLEIQNWIKILLDKND